MGYKQPFMPISKAESFSAVPAVPRTLGEIPILYIATEVEASVFSNNFAPKRIGYYAGRFAGLYFRDNAEMSRQEEIAELFGHEKFDMKLVSPNAQTKLRSVTAERLNDRSYLLGHRFEIAESKPQTYVYA